MLAFLHVAMARLRAFLRPGSLEREFDQELAAHLAMAEEEKIRQGLSPAEARRVARVDLGGLSQVRVAGREARGLPQLDLFWLDIKLSLRMLRRSWGLTLVGGLAMTIAIGIGVVIFALLEMFFWPTLPLDEGDRVVAIQTWDEKAHRRHSTAVSDLERWRDALGSVVEVGAFQTVERNLAIGDGAGRPVSIAEMSPSGFQLARVPPLLGRPLVAEDARPGAALVVVLGHDVWQSSFAADPAIVGRTVRLGDTVHSVVGVMPPGFAFPMNYSYWTPLSLDFSGELGDGGGEGVVFARLAPGVSLEKAAAELSALGLLPTAASEAIGAELRPRIVPYTFAFTGDFERGEVSWVVRLILFLITLLLVPPCTNIAILVYARTITRQNEFASRAALGASRGRIVGQLFIEVLVLSSGAAGVALLLASLGGAYLRHIVVQEMGGGVPFWIDFTLSFRTVLFAAGLAFVAALVAGVIPALKAIGRQKQSGFHALGSRTGMRLGATWTVLVVTQVALSLAALPSAMEMGWGTIRKGILGPGFAAEEFLTARLVVDRGGLVGSEVSGSEEEGDPRAFASRLGALQADLLRQLQAEPGVLGISVAASAPGDEEWVDIEIEGVPQPDEGILDLHRLVRFNRVDAAFFDLFDIPLLAGRGFGAADFEPPETAVIVNQTFVRQLVGEANPLGLRLRHRGGLEPPVWYEIVGVVADLPANATNGTMYHPAALGQVHPASLAIHTALTPSGLGERLREIAMGLDPALRVEEVLSLDEIYRQHQIGNNLGALTLAIVTLSVLLLSAAGMYALMSFTVNQGRREIGIRSALGAQPSHLLAGTFKRASGQVGVGLTAGALVALLLDYYLPIEEAGGWNIPGIIPAAAAFMLVVGLLAVAGPARRGLRVDPIGVLREG